MLISIKKLLTTVSGYAANIDKLGVLAKAAEKIASMHLRTNVKPEHYPLVGLAILGAVKDVLDEAATDEVIGTWKEAYLFLADILMLREKELYAAA